MDTKQTHSTCAIGKEAAARNPHPVRCVVPKHHIDAKGQADSELVKDAVHKECSRDGRDRDQATEISRDQAQPVARDEIRPIAADPCLPHFSSAKGTKSTGTESRAPTYCHFTASRAIAAAPG
jgi:hypothetical protein